MIDRIAVSSPPSAAGRRAWRRPELRRIAAASAENAYGGADDTPSGFTGS